MLISDLLSPERIRCDVKSSSKKRLLELISEELARNSDEFTKREIFESLCARERLGSTGLGKGVAIPHGRITGLLQPVCAFIRLEDAIEFDATDGQPVDLAFALLVPEDSTEEHLQVLSQIAELFSDQDFCNGVRNCRDRDCLVRLLLSRRDVQQIPA